MPKLEPNGLAQWLRYIDFAGRDALEPYRDHIWRSMGIATEILLTPFTLNNFVQGRPFVAFVLVVIQLIILADIWLTWHRKPLPVPRSILMLPFMVGITVAIVEQGVPGTLWSYPVVLFGYFVLTRRVAIIASGLLLIHVCGMAYVFIDPALALRLFATLSLTIIMLNVVLNVIYSLHQALEKQAVTDPLTGAFNRRFMSEHLDAVVSRAQRRLIHSSILMIDVDHFKQFNDRLGHDQGDEVLRRVVQLAQERMRLTDRIFRFGGEEFLLLLEDTPVDGAMVVAEAIRQSIESAEFASGMRVTVSIGVGEYETGQTVDQWIKAADQALYAAKAAGRNCIQQVDSTESHCSLKSTVSQWSPLAP